MPEVLFSRKITTLDLNEARIELDPDDMQKVGERFGFTGKRELPISWTGETPTTATITDEFLFCPELRDRDDLLYQTLDFVYNEGMLVAVLHDDPELEMVLRTASLEKEIDYVTSRLHRQLQGTLAEIGGGLGYAVWVPENDQNAVRAAVGKPIELLDRFPSLTTDATANRIARLIDAVFVPKEPHQPPQLFEVESTTTIFSGLLRLSDVYCWRPDSKLFIVSHQSRAPKFRREIARPTFRSISRVVEFRTYDEIRDWKDRVSRGLS